MAPRFLHSSHLLCATFAITTACNAPCGPGCLAPHRSCPRPMPDLSLPTRTPKPVPVYYQGQPFSGEPDHWISTAEDRAGLKAGRYLKINRGKARVKVTTCLPKFPDHKDSMKSGWQSVAERTHSFEFRRDYGALQARLGTSSMQLVKVLSGHKHSKTRCVQRVSYSLRQCAEVNGTLPGSTV